MNDDRLSNMPDEILHHIIALLPTAEAASTCFLSRRWRYLWKYFHTLDFDETLDVRKLKRLVNQMLRGHHHSIDLESFRLRMDLDTTSYKENDFLLQLDEWVRRVVMYNVRKLDLMLWGVRVLYRLPRCVVGSGLITTLRLTNCGFEDTGIINLVSLRKLCLRKVEIATSTMREVISNCLVLEYLHLDLCDKMEALEGRSLSLKSIKVMKCYNLKNFRMDIPNIELFKFHNGTSPFVNQCQFRMLKIVSLVAEINNAMLRDLTSKCLLLEDLSLVRCTILNQIKISNDRLKRLKLCNCNELKTVELDAMGLKYFEYVGKEVVELTQFNTPSKVEVRIELNECKIEPDKLKTFLGMFNHVKLVTLVSDAAESVLIPEELLENSLPPLYHLTHLNFKARSKPNSDRYLKILNGVLSLSVHLEILAIVLGSLYINLKFEPKKTVDLQDFPNLNWTELPLEHLRCRLNQVDILDNGRRNKEIHQLVAFILGENAGNADMSVIYTSNSFSWKAI
ncbi:hypothetical protein ACHQM5_021112 [Ranunculus cassubicifolius]